MLSSFDRQEGIDFCTGSERARNQQQQPSHPCISIENGLYKEKSTLFFKNPSSLDPFCQNFIPVSFLSPWADRGRGNVFVRRRRGVWKGRKKRLGNGEMERGEEEATNYERGRQLVPPKSRCSSPTIFFLLLLPLLGRKEQKTQSFLRGRAEREREGEGDDPFSSPRLTCHLTCISSGGGRTVPTAAHRRE